jgi:hypothetical protein
MRDHNEVLPATSFVALAHCDMAIFGARLSSSSSSIPDALRG